MNSYRRYEIHNAVMNFGNAVMKIETGIRSASILVGNFEFSVFFFLAKMISTKMHIHRKKIFSEK